MRNIYYALAVLVVVSLQVLVANAAEVTLKHTITVTDDDITFGDVFYGAEGKSDYVIASAPAPGKKIVFNAKSLAFVANKHGLKWMPSRSVSKITVFRDGIRIPEQQILEELRLALEGEFTSPDFEINLSSRAPQLMVATDETPLVAVESVSYSASKEVFSAILVAPADSENARKYKVSGKIYPQILIPVTARLIPSGQEITEADLDFKLFRKSKVNRNVAIHIEDIIGKSPKRSIRTGGKITMSNLGDPVTVAKGKMVSVTLKSGGIALSMTGRALESGSTGDVIRVENIVSRKTIQAQIVNSQEVRIITPQQRLAAIQ